MPEASSLLPRPRPAWQQRRHRRDLLAGRCSARLYSRGRNADDIERQRAIAGGTFDSETSPTIGEFATRWSTNFDAAAVYAEALADAQTRLDEAQDWADRWQASLYEIQGILMQAQSV
ncbi:hypothetical protein [Rhizobium rhizophilum]|uniref:Phasin domain-containing protein n=1 Tax=Rhizobium rhizophilum TaxID=1850373 RepID=A0ABY2QUH6_9HYPH|nr:hypothetical protein [Rhizobium rhizophilum]THV14230.1 hypothetical protein E9677_15255 [Rhizobium rhizophilum]